MRDADLLIVIEAPGKIAALSRALAELRINADIKATGGSLFNLPKDRLGLDPDTLLPNEWIPERQRNVDELTQGLLNIKRVVIMTDADIEGELIASQVNAVLRRGGFTGTIQRASAPSLTAQNVQHALANVRDIDRLACVHAMARRAIDRGIGFLLSDPQNINGIAGRVRAQVLSSVAERPLNTHRVIGAHSIDPAWRIHAQGTGAQRKSMVALMKAFNEQNPVLFEQAIPRKLKRPAPPPPSGPEGILMIAHKLRIPVKEAERLLQRTYEAGRLSYPRTDSKRYSTEAQHWLKSQGRNHGLRMRSALLENEDAEHVQGAHEALHALDVDPRVGNRIEGLPAEEAALTLVSRRCLAAVSQDATVLRTQIPTQAIHDYLDSLGLPPVRAAIWKDAPDSAGWLMLERGMHQTCRIEEIPLDQAILGRLIEDHIGRPSTAVRIASSLSAVNLIARGALTPSGWANLHHIERVAPTLLGEHNLDACLEALGSDDLEQAIHGGYAHLGLNTGNLSQRAQAATLGAPIQNEIATPAGVMASPETQEPAAVEYAYGE